MFKAGFPNIGEATFEKIIRKGFFPYNFFYSFEKFNEPSPPHGPLWYNSLTKSVDITKEQHTFAFGVYNGFKSRKLGDYHDVYLRTDVLIFGDIFQKFREVCMQVYNFDPAHFYSAPKLSWDAMLITTGAKLELLQDIDQLLFFEKKIRGGINGLRALRRLEANKMYLENFNPKEESTFGDLFDVPSLYAGTMQKEMPVGGYKWCTEIILSENLSTFADSAFGYIVEVDLAYPAEVHDVQNILHLAPEKFKFPTEWSFDYANSFGLTVGSSTEKLVETMLDKTQYIRHYENLKFYLKHGLKDEKLHRVAKFQQSKWFGAFIEKNTTMRKQASTDFEKKITN